jgi:hypothetical protein
MHAKYADAIGIHDGRSHFTAIRPPVSIGVTAASGTIPLAAI